MAITAAMPEGTGLLEFARVFPDRFIDVGIAEQHAVTMAAGLARGGKKPVVAIYSSFLQRAYDQILHDVCLQNLPVVFALDRAGVVGEDGPTHHGLLTWPIYAQSPGSPSWRPKTKMNSGRCSAWPWPWKNRWPSVTPRAGARGEQTRGAGSPRPGGGTVPRGTGCHLRPGTFGGGGGKGRPSSLAAGNWLRGDQRPLCQTAGPGRLSCTGPAACRTWLPSRTIIWPGALAPLFWKLLADEGVQETRLTRLGYPDRFVEFGPQQKLRDLYGLNAEGICRAVTGQLLPVADAGSGR